MRKEHDPERRQEELLAALCEARWWEGRLWPSGSCYAYCPQCGTSQPRVMICTRYQEVLLLPVHLLARDANVQLHCVACGEPHLRTSGEESAG